MNHPNEQLEFACPHCQSHLKAARQLAGQRIQCSHCHKRLKVPGSIAKQATSRASDYAYRQVKQKSDKVTEPEQLREAALLPDSHIPEIEQAKPRATPSPTARDQQPRKARTKGSTAEAKQGGKAAAEHAVDLDDVGFEPALPMSDAPETQEDFGLQDLAQPVDLFEGLPDRPTRTRAQLEAETAREEETRRAAQPRDPNEMFSVRCPLCDSVLTARYRQIGSKIRCSDCHTEVRVVAPEESRERRRRLGPMLAPDVEAAPTSEQDVEPEDEYRLAEEPQPENTSTHAASPPQLDQEMDAFLSGDDLASGPATELDHEYSLQPVEEEEPTVTRNAGPAAPPTIPSVAKTVTPPVGRPEPLDDELVIREEPADNAKPSPRAPASSSHHAAGRHVAEHKSSDSPASAWSQPRAPSELRTTDYGSEGRTIGHGAELLSDEGEQKAPLDNLTFSVLVHEVRSIVTAPSVLLAVFFVTLTLAIETSLLTWFENSAREMFQAKDDLLAQRVAAIKWYIAMGAAAFVGLFCLVQLSVFGARLIQATAGRERSPDITSEFGPFEVFNDAVLFCVPLIVALVPAAFLSGITSLLTHSVLASRVAGLVIFMVFPPLIMSVMKSDKFYGVVDGELFQSLGTETSIWRSLWLFTACVIAVITASLFLHGFRSYGLNLLVSPFLAVSFLAYFAAIGVSAHVLGNRLMGASNQPSS